ncbi:hypothetical protein CFN78_20575 [Amycolatopsis antarctica]|uniref:Uncharacterized protein n=1 Tax=Amycolatopsis antarctica TaxID=1854586 RepID=A0A263D1I2_9PSEU|nr:hypothetical protein CFN78_20575 [Amycolatopsis antarctica]
MGVKALAAATTLLAWLILHAGYTTHYASLYFHHGRGMSFPGVRVPNRRNHLLHLRRPHRRTSDRARDSLALRSVVSVQRGRAGRRDRGQHQPVQRSSGRGAGSDTASYVHQRECHGGLVTWSHWSPDAQPAEICVCPRHQ